MGLNVAPAFRIIAKGQDVTARIRERFKSLRLTDETGLTSDTVEITLADHLADDPIPLPSTGAELEIFIGYDDAARRMGVFVVDEIELAGFPGEITIRARAAPQDSTGGGRPELQTQKTRSWKRGTTIGEMVRKIASDHGLTPAVAGALAGIALPHTDQAHESDMNLLSRIAKRHDAIAKPAGGSLVFAKRGDAQSASGAPLGRVELTPKDGNDVRVTIANRDSAGTCVAYYRDRKAAKRREVTAGEGDPVKRIRMAFPDQASAEAAVRAELRKRARAEQTLFYAFPGRPDVLAESLVAMSGFRPGIDGDWLVTRAEHYIGPNGYRCTIEAEQPNSSEAGRAAAAAAVDDKEQTATSVG